MGAGFYEYCSNEEVLFDAYQSSHWHGKGFRLGKLRAAPLSMHILPRFIIT